MRASTSASAGTSGRTTATVAARDLATCSSCRVTSGGARRVAFGRQRTSLSTATTTTSKTSTSKGRLVIAAAALPAAHEAIEHAQAAADALHHFLTMTAAATSEVASSSSSSGILLDAPSAAIHSSSIGDLADAAAATAASASASASAVSASSSASTTNNNDWLAPVANSLETTLTFFQQRLESAGVPYSYGWAIVLLTAATKVATFPFTRKQVESALAVQKLKPAIDDIKRQYGEADKESVQRETSALYEKAGVDPAAGCLPTLLTLPIFWGLYRALTNVAASGDASVVDQGFYWVPSLSGPTTVEAQRAGTGTSWLLPFVDGAPPGGWEHAAPYLVLPVLLVLAQYASSAIISPTSSSSSDNNDDEGAGAQFSKALVAFLPLLVGWFALNVPSGIALYYFANTVLTSAVQIWLRKLGGATAFEFQQEIGVSQAKRSESGSGSGGSGEEALLASSSSLSGAVGSLPRAGEVGALEAAWLLDFDAAAVVDEAMAVVSSSAAPPAAAPSAAPSAEDGAAAAVAPDADSDLLSEEELEARKAAAALAALPVTTRSKRRRAGGLPEGAASRLAEEDERERERLEKEKGVGAGLIAAVTGKK